MSEKIGVKQALQEKFVSVCRDLGSGVEVEYGPRTKSGVGFLFPTSDENLLMEVEVDWIELIDLISDRSKLEAFLADLYDVSDGDSDEEDDDPFMSGELAVDADGRVHFQRDLE